MCVTSSYVCHIIERPHVSKDVTVYSLMYRLVSTHTHTHTRTRTRIHTHTDAHTPTERERERERLVSIHA